LDEVRKSNTSMETNGDDWCTTVPFIK
jgi:hypothetical protein